MKAAVFSVTFVLFTWASLAHAGFRDNGDGTVTDLNTNFTWQKCSAPAAGVTCSAPGLFTWSDALSYCNTLALAGHTDWRLPNVKVLHSILDVTKPTAPAVDLTYFPDTEAAEYWTSTTFVDTTTYAWYVQFAPVLTMTSPLSKDQMVHVRCVRGG